MSTHDSDGIDEALQGVTQIALTTAGRMGEQMARLRERQAREAQARSEQAAREHAERMSAEQEAARAALAPVHRDQWWEAATPEDVTRAYRTARAWRDVDPQAAHAESRIIEQAQARHGVTVSEQRTKAASERAEAAGLLAGADGVDALAEVENEREHQAQERGDDVAGLHADHEATAHDTAHEQRDQAGYAYDSAERRTAMANKLDHIDNLDAVDARVRSDVAQGRPATEAVSSGARPASRARKTKGSPQAARTHQRGGPRSEGR